MKYIFALALTFLSFLPAVAAQDDAPALYAQAQKYFVKKDFAPALDLYRKAAEAPSTEKSSFNHPGAAEAKCMVGDIYADGLGTPPDVAEAAKWWQLPADKFSSLKPLADKGDANAALKLADLYARSPCKQSWRFHGHEATMSTADPGRSFDEAVAWYHKSAETGNATAESRLGKYYARLGRNDEATGWFKKAAAQGDMDAKKYLDHAKSAEKSP